jgi:hypothetical protein
MVQPILHNWLCDVVQCFLTLHTQRTRGEYGSNPISITDMQACFALLEVDNKKQYLQMILALDKYYLRFEHEQRKRESN